MNKSAIAAAAVGAAVLGGPITSYADLLKPVPNASQLIKEADWYRHCYGPYNCRWEWSEDYQHFWYPRYRHHHHHHHHHHHNHW